MRANLRVSKQNAGSDWSESGLIKNVYDIARGVSLLNFNQLTLFDCAIMHPFLDASLHLMWNHMSTYAEIVRRKSSH